MDGFSAREEAHEPICEHVLCFCQLSRQVEVVIWHGIYRVPSKVGPLSFVSVSWADPRKCALKNDADSRWYCLEMSVFRIRRGQISSLNSNRCCVPFVPGLLKSL